MTRSRFFLFTFSCVFIVTSAEVNLTGTVKDELGAPVQGAQVRLKSLAGTWALTNPGGIYLLTGAVAAIGIPRYPMQNPAAWEFRNGMITLNLDAPAEVSIGHYDLKGAQLFGLETKLGAGMHRFPLTRSGTRSDVLRVRIGNHVSALKVRAPNSSRSSGQGSGALGKALAGTDSLIVTHPYFDRFAAPVPTLVGMVNATLTYQRLRQDEYFRVLAPNGGEVFNYGKETMKIAWLQDVTPGVSSAAVVSISKNAGLFFCDIPFSEQEWNRYPRDRDATGYKSYKLIDPTKNLVIGFFNIPVKDSSLFVCKAEFIGDKMLVKAWEPYPPAGRNPAELSDESDAPFTVSGHP